jgi:hypothetical protein
MILSIASTFYAINLKQEAGYEVDIVIAYNSRDVNFEVEGFYNYINNFTFSDRLGNKDGEICLSKGTCLQING